MRSREIGNQVNVLLYIDVSFLISQPLSSSHFYMELINPLLLELTKIPSIKQFFNFYDAGTAHWPEKATHITHDRH